MAQSNIPIIDQLDKLLAETVATTKLVGELTKLTDRLADQSRDLELENVRLRAALVMSWRDRDPRVPFSGLEHWTPELIDQWLTGSK